MTHDERIEALEKRVAELELQLKEQPEKICIKLGENISKAVIFQGLGTQRQGFSTLLK